MDLLSAKGDHLKEFMSLMNLTNNVDEPTRIAFYKNKVNKTVRTTKTNIDNVITNGDYVKSTQVLGCPFSDHMFVIAKLNFKCEEPVDQFIYNRDLSDENMSIFEQLMKREDFTFLSIYKDDISSKWQAFINRVADVTDSIAPIVKKKIKSTNSTKSYPWFDVELRDLQHTRDT